jgi:hypothetical protein
MTEKIEKTLEVMKEFQETVKDFLGELVEQFPNETDFIIMRIFLIEQIPIEFLITQFSKYVLPHREKIKKREEKFFLTEKGLFGIYEKEGKSNKSDRILHFKKLWNSGYLDDDDKEMMFRWFDKFLSIIDKYNNLKEKRE